MHFSHLVKVRKNSHSLSLQAFLTHSHSLSLSLAGLPDSVQDSNDPKFESAGKNGKESRTLCILILRVHPKSNKTASQRTGRYADSAFHNTQP